MSIHACVYTKPNCMKCKLTENKLREVMAVKLEHLFAGNDSWSERKLEKFRKEGYQSFPVVRIYDDQTGERLDAWAGFEIAKIQHWVQVATESNSK